MRMLKKYISIHWMLKLVRFFLGEKMSLHCKLCNQFFLKLISFSVFQFLNFVQNKNAEYRTAPASVQNFFAKIAGEDMEVDAEELQQILNYALKKGKNLV